jgi:hypothetical protein
VAGGGQASGDGFDSPLSGVAALFNRTFLKLPIPASPVPQTRVPD